MCLRGKLLSLRKKKPVCANVTIVASQLKPRRFILFALILLSRDELGTPIDSQRKREFAVAADIVELENFGRSDERLCRADGI